MGIDNSVHFGPYIKVYKKEKTVEHFKMVNETTGQKFDLNTTFDPTTGTKLVLIKTGETKERSEPDPIIEDGGIDDFDDTFWTPEYIGTDKYTIFLPNSNKYKSIDEYSQIDYDLKGFDYSFEIVEFKNLYRTYIDHYKKEYGSKNVEVCYGIVSYAN